MTSSRQKADPASCSDGICDHFLLYKLYMLPVVFMIFFMSALPGVGASTSEIIPTVEAMREFMKGSFIQKETGFIPNEAYADRLNLVKRYADGFNPNWAVYRFHHVCLRGGSDGLYSGFLVVPFICVFLGFVLA